METLYTFQQKEKKNKNNNNNKTGADCGSDHELLTKNSE